jgi:phosphoribosylformylglycinamidine synthase
MKARVHVSLKPTVLDPQGQTICAALNEIGHSSIRSVRQGKFFDIALEGATDEGSAKALLKKIADEVLANPVIENFEVELLSD